LQRRQPGAPAGRLHLAKGDTDLAPPVGFGRAVLDVAAGSTGGVASRQLPPIIVTAAKAAAASAAAPIQIGRRRRDVRVTSSVAP
jgi:hypothetical protein